MNQSTSIVRVSGVMKDFTMGKTIVQVLKGIDLDIKAGEYVSIMGPSGSGKTTLFNMIGGLDKPSSGSVFIDEIDISQLDAYELAWLRCRKIGYIFQTFNIIQVMTALENVTLPMIFAGVHNDAAVEKGIQLLKLVGLGDRFRHKPSELSGGQQQRVAVARALANDPAIILADEPTGNLDSQNKQEIIKLLANLNLTQGTTIIMVTHDSQAANHTERMLLLKDGKIIKEKEGLHLAKKNNKCPNCGNSIKPSDEICLTCKKPLIAPEELFS